MRPPPPAWPPWTAPLALVAGLTATLFGATVIGGIAAAAGAKVSDPPPGVQIGSLLFQDLALIGAALAFARLASHPRPWHFGLRRTRLGPALGWLLAVWTGFFVFTGIWINALGIHQRDQLPKELGVDRSTAALVVVTFLVTVMAPIAEEFFFRGYFFTALRSWKGPWVAAVITGVVFGAIHGGSAPVGYLVPLSVFGFGLCLLYWRTRSLYPCMSLHALNNSLALGVSQHWSWQIPVVMVAANLVIAGIMLPISRAGPAAAPAPASP
ncbi:MAG TPA: type II CAAX endopeptidase family protein [Solirubrobacteraceae bacterium]|nr:type II CAAX endopeptidase family protein [Solirubrobacteraceae bacterium]